MILFFRSCFLFRTISSTTTRARQFLQPLSVKVWYVTFCTIAIATTVLMVLIRQEGIRSVTEGYDISLLLTLGALSQQSAYYGSILRDHEGDRRISLMFSSNIFADSVFVPVHYAGRIAFLHIMLFSLLIANYYSASIVSNRLKNQGEKMNDSLISLANSNLKLTAEFTPYIRSILQVNIFTPFFFCVLFSCVCHLSSVLSLSPCVDRKSSEKEIRYFNEKRWNRIPEFERYLPLADGLNRLAQGGLAYHTSVDTAYPYIDRHFHSRMICELTEIHLFRAVLALWTRHKSPFTPLLRVG